MAVEVVDEGSEVVEVVVVVASDQELTPWVEEEVEEATPADGNLSLLTFSFSFPVYDSF